MRLRNESFAGALPLRRAPLRSIDRSLDKYAFVKEA